MSWPFYEPYNLSHLPHDVKAVKVDGSGERANGNGNGNGEMKSGGEFPPQAKLIENGCGKANEFLQDTPGTFGILFARHI